LVQNTPLVRKPDLLNDILAEAEELIRIFAASIRTAKSNAGTAKPNLSVKCSELNVARLATPRARQSTP
jgi:hypothetical protein